MHQSFREGFEKIAFNLADARKAYAARVKPRLIRAGADPEAFSPAIFQQPLRKGPPSKWHKSFAGGKGHAQAIMNKPPTHQADYMPRFRGKILASGSATPYGVNHNGHYYGAYSPEEKELVNRITGLHEADELAVKPGPRFFTHASPDVLLRESNMLATVPEDLAGASDINKILRNLSGESQKMSDLLPGFEFGITRLSRHGRKRANEIMSAKLMKEEQDAMDKSLADIRNRFK